MVGARARLLALGFWLTSGGAFGASAADDTSYVIDRDHTKVEFEVSHLAFSTVGGQFREFDGEFHFDEKDFAKTTLEANAKVASLFTDSEKRDNHLRSPDFFDAGKYPLVTFKAKRVEAVADKRFKLVGDLTMHGVTKSVTFDVQYLGSVTALGKHRVGFKAETKVIRQDYGMNFSTLADSLPLVGDEVTIRITAQGFKKSDL
jgi:polyisoprenoid-binding protein YceI